MVRTTMDTSIYNNHQHGISTWGHIFNMILWCIPAIFLGFMIIQGHHISLQNYFTPWHHDDLSHLGEIVPWNFWVTRPVSTNFIWLFGPLGETIYYALFTAIALLSLFLTHSF